MAEYIEREALLKDIEEEKPENWTDSEAERQAESDFYKYRGIVEIQPTADVVEAVRCKDCKKWDETRRFGISCACSHWSPSIKDCRFTLPDGFCSEGIRKEGAENG